MTSESEAFKTNEFLRRRKLRIQQVREQSKEIAKRIRQRAKVEKLKEVGELDAKKQKEYFHHQDKLVKKLEQLYAAGVRNVGASHKQASEVNVQDIPEKLDISKKRGRQATAELRRKKQEKLDDQKKLLDRKLQAREAANEISRDKSLMVASKLLKASSSKTGAEANNNEVTQQNPENQTENIVNREESSNKEVSGSKAELVDMTTQWNFEELPEEWEPHIPELLIPKDDKQSPNETAKKSNEVKPDQSKPQNLFALSDEMPSSLRGGLVDNPMYKKVPKTTLNLVSEYLQNRDLHLREYETTSEKSSKKKHDVDLQSLRNTILRARASNNEGILDQNVCHVADVQVVPVPSWHAENRCRNCPQHVEFHRHTVPSRQFKAIANHEINQIFSSIRPKQHDMPSPSPVLRGVSPFKRSKFDQKSIAGRSSHKSTKSNEFDIPLVKKKSVTMYDHSTRDTKDIPCGDKKLVVRDALAEEDAYAQAARESASVANDDGHQRKLQDMRNKIAMTKQNVEKEYRDTMTFLKALPKDKSKPIKYAYMDEDRQESHKELRQKKMQGDFKKIEKECKKQALNEMNLNRATNTQRRTKSKSPDKFDSDEDFEAKDFQYSWMPVPETDQNLAIHTIPTNTKERKSTNGVHFSKVDSYHEYRSRHKHTPPTKDTNAPKKQMEPLKTLVIEEDAENSGNSSTFDSENVSSDTMTPRGAAASNGDDAGKLSDAERIIIYKILDTKVSKRDKEKRNKVMTKIARSLNPSEKTLSEDDARPSSSKGERKTRCTHKAGKAPVFEQINEGIYKTVNEKRPGYNITSCYATNIEMWRNTTDCKPWWDNITSMYFSERSAECVEAGTAAARGHDAATHGATARAPKVHWESSGEPTTEPREASSAGSCKKAEMPSATTSTSSFRTASNAITQVKPVDGQIDGGYIKLLDEDGQEAGKFYIGATGFIKNDAYEVIIQLKKKDDKSESANVHKTSSTLLEDNTNSFAQMKNKEDAISREETDNNPLSEEKSKQMVDQNKSPRSEDLNKQHKLINTAIATENSEEIHIVSYDKPAIDSENKESNTQYEPSTSKDNSVPKHATTCTQTSFENHEERHRPMRMSSTSTAYMSPPEFILPNFLKQDHKISLAELQDFTVNSNLEGIEFMNRESLCCGDFEYCRCKRCIYEKTIIQCRKSRHKEHRLKAPPNTVRSEVHDEDIKLPHEENMKRRHNHKSKHIHSCRKRSGTKTPMIYFAKYNKSMTSTKRSYPNFVPTVNPKSITSRNRKKNKDSNMNPLIKSYVNKLLNLNKKALKAIEVANQDCSSITTPGSSVVEVSLNKDHGKSVEPKISIEQIKDILIQDIINVNEIQRNKYDMPRKDSRRKCYSSHGLKKGSMRKVKSLYVPRKISKAKSNDEDTSHKDMKLNKPVYEPSKLSSRLQERKSTTKLPCKTSSTSTTSPKSDDYVIPSAKDSIKSNSSNQKANWEIPSESPAFVHNPQSSGNNSARSFEPVSKGIASGSESNGIFSNLNLPPSTSTQTNLAENNLMKLAEDKLQNMEKIAELTEKCTKRLSSLAKVLEQVRKNKTVYSQISDSASDSDKMSENMVAQNKKTVSSCGNLESKIRFDDTDTLTENIQPEPDYVNSKDHATLGETENATGTSNYVLSDIPKPLQHKTPSPTEINGDVTPELISSKNINEDLSNLKVRAKPPPALSRISLRQGHDLEFVVPHELSTVAEMDSPLSAKLKSQSARNDSQELESNESRQYVSATTKEQQLNPDLLQNNAKLPTGDTKVSIDTSDDSKIQMLDLKQFNEIMLKPFISIQDYVKQYSVPTSVDDGSNIEQHQKESPISDDISSLHSDGSLPDVIAELLKRNVIKEPFKFDTASNVNSTTISSESTFSVLALSKAKMEKKSHALKIQNKENIAETSDSLSISSNPDLELAFKQLGMGWASSTLKKTKERLALSSSSNTSSSSTGMHLKVKANNIDVPYVVSDTVSSLLNLSKRKVKDPSKNAEQQTSQIDSMTVKDFLTNQLAKKITFTNKSRRDGTEEFISLCETRIPEDMQQSSQVIDEMNGTSGGNRARTSTPVQIFKSMAFHSSSSSNISNGLFSNADELSSVKGTSNSIRNHSTSDKDDLTIPNYNLNVRKGLSDTSKSD